MCRQRRHTARGAGAVGSTLQHAAPRCNTLQPLLQCEIIMMMISAALHCNTRHHTHTHTQTHTISHTHTLSLSHTHTRTHTLSHIRTHTPTRTPTHTNTHNTHIHTHKLTHTHTHILSLSISHTQAHTQHPRIHSFHLSSHVHYSRSNTFCCILPTCCPCRALSHHLSCSLPPHARAHACCCVCGCANGRASISIRVDTNA